MEPQMKAILSRWDGKVELTRVDRIVLHLKCLCRDHKYRWHLAGVWREIALA
jgi:hypothetical protein